MKKILLLPAIILLLLAHQLGAQPKYGYAANLDAYVGTWVYQNADTVFTLVIKKGTQNTNFYNGDCLVGGYKLEKDGVVVADYTQNLPDEITDDNYYIPKCPSFIGTNGQSKLEYVNSNILRIVFSDRNLLRLEGALKLIPPSTFHLKLKKPEQVILLEEGQTVEDPDISVPEDVIMTKVE